MTRSLADRIIRFPKRHDQERAERTLQRLGGLAGSGQARELIAAVASNSPYLARISEREAEHLNAFMGEPPELAFSSILNRLPGLEILQRVDAMRVLREVKRQASLLIALADAGGVWSLEEVTRALTELADDTLRAALRYSFVEAIERGRLVSRDGTDPVGDSGIFMLAMGKYGAHELNYSSDIDFSCYFNPEKLLVPERYSPQEVAVRITQGTVSLMQEATQDGYVFRCDLRLRPDAGSTQIAVSTRAAEGYYESMGQNWERAAMIKARVCAGDLAEGREFLRHLQPFVWRKYLDYAAIEDIHSIKRQIHAHGGHGEVGVAGHNVKLGRGGIREIEFFAQTQQLILGGRISSLRSSRTVDALEALLEKGVIEDSTCGDLKRAYEFLRTLEHRLQMIEDEQTHTMPKSDEGLLNVARFMGFDDVDQLSDALRSVLVTVQGHYQKLFESQPSLSKAAGSLVFTGVDDDPETIVTLRNMGFSQPEAMSATIRGWHHGRVRATRSERAREKLTALMPLLLEALGQTANPDIAFTRFDKFISGLPSGVQVFALLLSNPELLGLIAEIVGTAPRLADHLAARPGLLDVLIDSEFLKHQPGLNELCDSLDGLLKGEQRFEGKLDVVRRWTKDQQFRVGLQLLKYELDGIEAGQAFTDVAEAAIAALYDSTLDEMRQAHGTVPTGGMCVIGMGRLGSCEMSSTSDLDLIFVYEHAADVASSDGERPISASVYFARLAQRLITALTAMTAEGGLFDVDMRLRPSGNKGPVAVSFETFRNYQMNEAWTWERLALTRGRVVAGPAELRDRVADVMGKSVSKGLAREQVLKDIADMRGRLDRERPAASPWDLKEARGGLFDIEFIAQGLQLVTAGAHPEVRSANTLAALERLAQVGGLSADDARSLNSALVVYQRLIQIIRLTVGEGFDPADVSRSLKVMIARNAGVASYEEVEPLIRSHCVVVRRIFERVIGPVAGS